MTLYSWGKLNTYHSCTAYVATCVHKLPISVYADYNWFAYLNLIWVFIVRINEHYAWKLRLSLACLQVNYKQSTTMYESCHDYYTIWGSTDNWQIQIFIYYICTASTNIPDIYSFQRLSYKKVDAMFHHIKPGTM